MVGPHGRIKKARISVSFEPHVYGALILLAKRQDIPVAQLIRRAVSQLVIPETRTDPSTTAEARTS